MIQDEGIDRPAPSELDGGRAGDGGSGERGQAQGKDGKQGKGHRPGEQDDRDE